MGFLDKIRQNQFNIRISTADKGLFSIINYKVIKEIQSTNFYFAKHPIVINADPFLFVHNKVLYLFYEEQRDLRGKGIIKMINTKDLKNWSKPKIVLKEKFHLSFPNVFQDDLSIYMMPESGNDNCINLYIPNSDLTQWTHYKTLLSGKNFVDSSIIVKDSIYYLFTSIFENDEYKFLIYTADSLNGEWKLHPAPVKWNNNRCGGAVFKYENEYYRPTQLTENNYGEGLIINKILELTPENYSEENYLKLIPNSDNFYKLGGHHFNFCEFIGYKIVATDALSSHVNFWEVCRRIKDKFLIK